MNTASSNKQWSDDEKFPDSSQVVDRTKLENVLTKEQFWWFHLTFEQRTFIRTQFKEKAIVHGVFTYENAHKIDWTKVIGYPSNCGTN
jgi:hypothetical protein